MYEFIIVTNHLWQMVILISVNKPDLTNFNIHIIRNDEALFSTSEQHITVHVLPFALVGSRCSNSSKNVTSSCTIEGHT